MIKATSSSFVHEWAYDVFLSFRGEDTRMGFTGNLYNALCAKGINTFMDDHELKKGEEITPALMRAIEGSRIAIVIFSRNYAWSTFCLEELVKIMECLEHKGRLVWPVFYDVDPCDVRHQRGSYGEALEKHERRMNNEKEKVKKWRFALHKSANLSGWHFQHGYEYEFIGKIIEGVSKKFNRIPLHVANYAVGLEPRVQKVNSLLDVESNDGVHVIGIYGIGSDLYGKTKLEWNSALDSYEKIPHEDILDILRVSYDGLKEFEKEIFLDMACFFKGYYLTDVINILCSGRGSTPEYGIRVLIDKCLIKIDQHRVRMHDLIEDMGREIVRLESPLKPGERSRLWFAKDIVHVFKKNKGSDKTEIIMLHLLEDKKVKWDGNALMKMENLKILMIIMLFE
uniref:TMV resistance protein N n=1 Tax=Cajanus cajan TaxID=3821 RepID=A0A151TFT5_CAJCA|nr:TMV resistance protein N [Cajanus cajan]